MNIHPSVKNILKGAVIGSSMLIPGMSGGTTAIVLNIYDALLKAVGSLFDNLKKNLIFLFQVFMGGAIGILFFSKLILALTEHYPQPMMFLFIGVVLGSIPTLFRKARLNKSNLFNLLWVLPGAALSLSLRFIPQQLFVYTEGTGGFFLCVLCGIVIAVALILPGISTSHVLLLMGMYEAVWQAVSRLDFLFLFPILVGGVLGTLCLTKLLSVLLERFQTASYCMIAGFVLGSVGEMLPQMPSGGMIGICFVCLTFGLAGILLLCRNVRE